MEEISVLGLVARSLASKKSQPFPELRLFEGIFLPRYMFWRGWGMSVALHILCIFVLLPFAERVLDSDAEAMGRHARAMGAIEIRIPDRLYLSRLPPPEPEQRPAPPPAEMAKAKPAPPAPKLEPSPLPPRQFRLPNLPRRDADLTLIQTHLPPDLALTEQVKLPQLLLTGPPVPPRPFVEPGRSPPPVVAPKVDAPPELAMATSSPSDLQVPSMLAGPEDALLHLPRPTVQAERAFQAPPQSSTASGRGTSLSPTQGEPINIISISSDPAPLTEIVRIPLGSQIGRLPGPPPPDADSPIGIPSAGSGSGTGTGAAGSAGGQPGGTGTGAGSLAGVPGGTGTGPGAPGGTGTGPGGPGGTGTGAGGGVAGGTGTGGGVAGGTGTGLASSLKYSVPIRIEHPSNAVFDVVVVQSSVEESFPETAGILTGRPVYTVYVQVGSPRAWLMQYCLPGNTEKGPEIVGSTVYIGRPTPVKAPYPLVTVLPPGTMLPRTAYIMVHGFLDKTGKFTDLRVVRAPNDEVRKDLLPQLVQWQFRPATRDGVPVLVEILLAIPPQQG